MRPACPVPAVFVQVYCLYIELCLISDVSNVAGPLQRLQYQICFPFQLLDVHHELHLSHLL